jgi:hypothetical protein
MKLKSIITQEKLDRTKTGTVPEFMQMNERQQQALNIVTVLMS